MPGSIPPLDDLGDFGDVASTSNADANAADGGTFAAAYYQSFAGLGEDHPGEAAFPQSEPGPSHDYPQPERAPQYDTTWSQGFPPRSLPGDWAGSGGSPYQDLGPRDSRSSTADQRSAQRQGLEGGQQPSFDEETTLAWTLRQSLQQRGYEFLARSDPWAGSSAEPSTIGGRDFASGHQTATQVVPSPFAGASQRSAGGWAGSGNSPYQGLGPGDSRLPSDYQSSAQRQGLEGGQQRSFDEETTLVLQESQQLLDEFLAQSDPWAGSSAEPSTIGGGDVASGHQAAMQVDPSPFAGASQRSAGGWAGSGSSPYQGLGPRDSRLPPDYQSGPEGSHQPSYDEETARVLQKSQQLLDEFWARSDPWGSSAGPSTIGGGDFASGHQAATQVVPSPFAGASQRSAGGWAGSSSSPYPGLGPRDSRLLPDHQSSAQGQGPEGSHQRSYDEETARVLRQSQQLLDEFRARFDPGAGSSRGAGPSTIGGRDFASGHQAPTQVAPPPFAGASPHAARGRSETSANPNEQGIPPSRQGSVETLMEGVRDRAVSKGQGKTGETALQQLYEGWCGLNESSTSGRLISWEAVERRYRKMAAERKARPPEVTKQRKLSDAKMVETRGITIQDYRKLGRSKRARRLGRPEKRGVSKKFVAAERLAGVELAPENRFVKTVSGVEWSDDAVVYVKRMLSRNVPASDIALMLGGLYKDSMIFIRKLQSDMGLESDMDPQSDSDPQSDVDPQSDTDPPSDMDPQ